MKQEQNDIRLSPIQKIQELANRIWKLDTETELTLFAQVFEEISDDTLILKLHNRTYQQILYLPNREEFFEKLNIDWILKAFKHPELVFNNLVFEKALKKEITNPIQLTLNILERKNLTNCISPKQFYKKVFCDPYLDNLVKLNAIFRLLRVVKNPVKFLDEFLEPMYRYMYDEQYNKEVEKFIRAGKQLDISWSKERLSIEYMDFSVDYKGSLKLPESCMLITNRQDLKREGIKMRHCINTYWEQILNKKCFVIHMEQPQLLTFMISDFKKTKYFTFEAASGIENSAPTHEALSLMGRCIAEELNQQFFRENVDFSDIVPPKSVDIQALLATL